MFHHFANKNNAKEEDKENKRFSLPGSMTNSNLLDRRHTLIPTRSILKPTLDDNNTISIIPSRIVEKRRVSFAPEVTLHKINYFHNDDREKQKKSNKRSSLQFMPVPSSNNNRADRLSTHDYINKINKSRGENLSLSKIRNTESFAGIDEDNTTQTMEMSTELTQRILKQQEITKEQNENNCEYEKEKNKTDYEKFNIEDVFEDTESSDDQGEEEERAEKKKDENKREKRKQDKQIKKVENDNEVKAIDAGDNELSDMQITGIEDENSDMEITEPIIKSYTRGSDNASVEEKNVYPSLELNIPSALENEVDETEMEFTQPIFRPNELYRDRENLQPMEFTQTLLVCEDKKQIAEPSPVLTLNEGATQTMQFTLPVWNKDLCSTDDMHNNIEIEDVTQAEEVLGFIQPVMCAKNFEKLHNSKDEQYETDVLHSIPTTKNTVNIVDTETTMDFTGVIETPNKNKIHHEINDHNGDAISSDSPQEKTSMPHSKRSFDREENEEEYTPNKKQHSGELELQHDSSINSESKLSSDMETSLIATEMVPLAEIATDSLGSDNYDSQDDSQDDHVNIPLKSFLVDVDVQFYDSIGPSEREITQTLDFSLFDLSSSSPSASPSGASSATSTPLKNSGSTKSNLLDYIEAANNIPQYHYLIHLITQYRTSIANIRTIVSDFSQHVLENNPMSIREYYEQTEELKVDLKINYQAIANFARKQAKNENMKFLVNLLKQLIESYEKMNAECETELGKAMEWRRGLLFERQNMIACQAETGKKISELIQKKEMWGNMDKNKWKEVQGKVKDQSAKKSKLSEAIESLAAEVGVIEIRLDEKIQRREELKKEVKLLKDELKGLKVPSIDEIKKLNTELEALELKTGIKIVSIADKSKFDIFGELDVVMDINDGTKSVTVKDISKYDGMTEIIRIFESKMGSAELTGSQFLRHVKESWIIFKNILKDLMIISYKYSSVLNGSGSFKFEIYEKNKYNIGVEYILLDLFDFEKPVRVKLDIMKLADLEISSEDALTLLKNNPFAKKISIFERFVL